MCCKRTISRFRRDQRSVTPLVHSFSSRGGSAPTRAITPGPFELHFPWVAKVAGLRAPPRRVRPVHTDIICQAAGLITAPYSYGYVAHWSGADPAKVKDSAERVVATARTILERTGLLAPAPTPEAVAAWSLSGADCRTPGGPPDAFFTKPTGGPGDLWASPSTAKPTARRLCLSAAPLAKDVIAVIS